jgi:hypothetical protein
MDDARTCNAFVLVMSGAGGPKQYLAVDRTLVNEIHQARLWFSLSAANHAKDECPPWTVEVLPVRVRLLVEEQIQ